MSLVGLLKGKGNSGFGYASTAAEVTEGIDLSGKKILLTGCNSGLGMETLRILGIRGAHVLAAARTVDKARAALVESGAEGDALACDLSEPASVKACVAEAKGKGPLDGIIANAGIMALPKLEVKHGLDLQFLTNHVGHFILVTGLLDSLSDDARIVVLSSSAHKMTPKGGIAFDNLDGGKGYSAWPAYGQSKLANLLFVRHLAKKLAPSGRTVNAVHPGVIPTNLGRHMNSFMNAVLSSSQALFLKSIPEGAATTCYVATHPSLAEVSGKYFADCNIKTPSKDAQDDALAERLWGRTEEIVAGFEI